VIFVAECPRLAWGHVTYTGMMVAATEDSEAAVVENIPAASYATSARCGRVARSREWAWPPIVGLPDRSSTPRSCPSHPPFSSCTPQTSGGST